MLNNLAGQFAIRGSRLNNLLEGYPRLTTYINGEEKSIITHSCRTLAGNKRKQLILHVSRMIK